MDAQMDALIEERISTKDLRGIEKKLKIKDNGAIYFMNQIWVQKFSDSRKPVMNEAHKTRYSIHLGEEKTYVDLKKLY